MSGPLTKQALVHVIFAEGGIPAWFGPDPTAGSEPIDLVDLRQFVPDGVSDLANTSVWRQFLITHCRIDGEWLPRAPVMAEREADDLGEVSPEIDGSGDAQIDPVLPEAGTEVQDESQAS